MTIIETADNRLYRVTDHPDARLAHLYSGVEVERHGGIFVTKGNTLPELVRREGCRVLVEA